MVFQHARSRRLAAGAILATHAVLVGWASTRHSPTVDEIGHLPAGVGHWTFGRFDLYRVNPPLVRTVAAIPVVLAGPEVDWSHLLTRPYRKQLEFTLGSRFIADHGDAAFAAFVWARWACIPFSLLGAVVCYRWAGELYGPRAALVAMCMWCFSPNILANAQMITPDLGGAAFGAAAGYTFWRWLRRPSWPRAITAGLALGLAELSKSTWVVLFGLWPVLWVLASRVRPPAAPGVRPPGPGQLAVVLGLGLYVLNLGYGFEGSFEPLGNFDFVSRTLADPGPGPAKSTNRFDGTWAGRVPVPFPRHYVLGVDEQRRDFEQKMRSYLRGEWRLGGWWYYYLYAVLIKEPLGFLGLFAAAAVARCRRGGGPGGWVDGVVLLAPAVVVVGLVSSQTGFNHHVRYALPAYPFVYIWVSGVAERVAGRRAAGWTVGLALASGVAGSLSVYPHCLSYFNCLVGGPRGGHAHLVDSNIDWGQDLLYLRSWLADHPEARPLGLVYFGYFDPRAAGLEFFLPPVGEGAPPAAGSDPAGPPGPAPGWYAVSVNFLRGHAYNAYDGRGGVVYLDKAYFAYFLRVRPVAMAGYSIYIYHLTADDVARLRADPG